LETTIVNASGTTEQDLAPALQQLIDRQQIHDCILRYCSGVDRFDREMLLSVYHPDALDDHGAFVGGAAEFVDWALAYHGKYQHTHKHYVLNHRCELDGDTAHTETYWLFAGSNKIGPPASLHGGRYLDRFERRHGRWAIAARKCIIGWGGCVDRHRAAAGSAGRLRRHRRRVAQHRRSVLPAAADHHAHAASASVLVHRVTASQRRRADPLAAAVLTRPDQATARPRIEPHRTVA
jgi:ketosteroid isomerase-like protein